MAMVAYAGLAVLTWATIEDQRIRLVTVAVLAMFAVKSWVRRHDGMHSGDEVEADCGCEHSGSPQPKSRAQRSGVEGAGHQEF